MIDNINGTYRIYIKIPLIKYGIKIPRLFNKEPISFAFFLVGIIMNINERKRYLYYVKNKPMKQWGKMWRNSDSKESQLCPTIFSFFGLFNIVKHVEILKEEDKILLKDENVSYLTNDWFPSNVGLLNGNQVLIDYGDFRVVGIDRTLVGLIDYK